MEHQSDVVVVDVDVDVDVVVVDDDDYDDGNPTPPYFRSAPKGILPPKKKTHQQSSERRPKPLSSPNLLVG